MKLRLLVVAGATALGLAAPAAASPPTVDARAFVVANAATGEVLAADNADEQVPIASITKLMTVLVALEHVKLDEVATVEHADAVVGESSIHLRTGERISVHDLIAGALVQSANDAADALADYVTHGDRAAFLALMNAKARALGLTETHFARPDGLDAPGHYSSARDVLRLAEIAMHNAVIRQVVQERTTTISGGRVLHTWNDLFATFPGLIGVKTGHTNDAGWCEVAAARGRGLTVYAVILGSPSRWTRNTDLSALLAWGLSRYRVASVIDVSRTYARVKVGYGRQPLSLVATRPLVRSVRLGRPFLEQVVAPATASLPVRKGQQLGEVRVLLNGNVIGVRPLVATRSVSKPGLGGRLSFYAGRTVHHVWSWIS